MTFRHAGEKVRLIMPSTCMAQQERILEIADVVPSQQYALLRSSPKYIFGNNAIQAGFQNDEIEGASLARTTAVGTPARSKH